MRKRIVSLLMALVMILSLVPTTVFATEGETTEDLGTVHVIVENTTFTEATEGGKTPAWTGIKVNTDVALDADSTMMSCIEAAIEKADLTADIEESTYGKYISGIAGLKEFNGSPDAGWMGTLNDWFTSTGFSNYKFSDGSLQAGDEIRVMYTVDGGPDVGSFENDSDEGDNKTLSSLTVSTGVLDKAFSADDHTYTLSLSEGTTAVSVTSAAVNKNFQVRTYADGTEYRRGENIPVTTGTVITVKCGDPSWPSMNDTSTEAEVYTINVVVDGVKPAAPTAEVTIRSQAAGGYLHGFAEPVEVASDLAESYGFTDQVKATDGVSALDALVKAHEIAFEDAFTKDTVGEFLAVSDSGSVSKLFGTATYANGFFVNQGYPNDGTPATSGGYNGTMVNNTEIKDGDVVDFFVYQDASYYSDKYTWIELGEDGKTVTVTGTSVMMGYLYKTPADLKEAASPLEGVQLAWVDPTTGELTEIDGAVTDENGNATINLITTKSGYLVATGTDDTESPAIMNPSAQVTITAGEGIDITFSGVHDMQVASLKLYTYNNGVKGKTDLLDGIAAVDGAYSVVLPAGQYWVEGYDANNDCNGGLAVTVDAEHNSFKIQRIYQIYISPSSWVLGEDYTLSVKLTDAEQNVRDAELGTATSWGTVYSSCIFVVGDTVEATATPNAEKQPNFNPATAAKTPTMNDNLSLTCKEFVTITFKVPEGSTITVGTLASYYVYSYVDPVSAEKPNVYNLNKNTDYFYRVQNPNGVTYWNYTKWDASGEVEVTAADLYIGDDSFNKDTIYHHFEKNIYDRADIYLNINTQGYKNMAVGETFELNSFRNWFAIESINNAKVALPDMHYQVIDVDGKPSDVVTITPDEKNSNVATMTAKHEGTAIVLVTYDAMTHMNGMGGNTVFSAIWPECTGVFIVTVDNDGSSIQTNMVLDRMDADITKDEQKILDAEHDILFYLGSEGAAYSFKPEDGCEVTVARSTVGSAMTFNGFTGEGVTVAEDGTVTITGLTTGRHIVKVEKDGKANYQVITARGVSYDLVDEEGNVLTDEAKASIKAGDTVYLQFHDLISPKEKLSGAYNFNFSLYYEGEDGTYFRSDPGSQWGVYDFSGNPVRQKIAITIPKYWDGSSYTLTGAIKQAGWPGVNHRGITYAKGTDRGFNAPSVSGILSRLPEVTFALAETNFLTGKLTFKDNNGNTLDRNDLTITLTDSDGNVVTVNEDGTFKAVAEDYTYAISGQGVEYSTGTITLTADGENAFEITLIATSATAWDGTTMTEPQQIDGVYQIGTGAELAWFVNQSKSTGVSGVLTADIDLAKYVWLDISSAYRVELDGQGNKITGLNAKRGLFGQIGNNSHIQGLTLRGVSAGGGSVTGYATGSNIVIENCFSYVTINSTGNNAGGIVGYTNGTVTIRNCANFGNVTGSQNVGGIIGGFVSNGATVTGCYNTGAITATGSYAGGVFGNCAYGVTVDSCYNTGLVTADSNAGGIGGQAKGATNWMTGAVTAAMTVSNCYSTGTVVPFGSVDDGSVTITNCYAETADDHTAQLEQTSDLGRSYEFTCDGYPALSWQTGVRFHDRTNGVIKAPTCTEGGYTTYTCNNCDATYTSDYTDATGHTVPEGGKTQYLLYTIYTCTVCGETIIEGDDERLSHLTLAADSITSASVADNGDYPWQYNEDTGRFESTNKGKDSSSSETVFTFVLTQKLPISFGYGVSSEAGYDKFTATLSNGTDTIKVANAISGTVDETYSSELEAGTWTLTLTYTKDSGSSSGDDLAYVSDLTLSSAKQDIYKETGDAMAALAETTAPSFGIFGGEWMVLGLARSGRDVPNVGAYYQSVVSAVESKITEDGILGDTGKTTENARTILALTAIGKDVTDVGGHNLLTGLSSMSLFSTQPINGPIWALIALDSGNYSTSGDVTRAKLITAIVERQLDGTGWPTSSRKTYADIDMTAMAVQALAPYYNTNDSAKAAVDTALTWLASQQKDDGSFGNSSETNAQIVVMLCALDRDPTSDEQFTKDGKSSLDALCSYYLGNGRFAHQGTKDDQMATEQAFYALAAFNRLKNGQTFLYDMTDVIKKCGDNHSFSEWVITKEATCTEDGSKTRTCSVCGTVETEVIAATGHSFSDWAVTKEPTCTETGVKTRTCSVCQVTETQVIAALGHDFSKWEVTTDATCTTDGESVAHCQHEGCNETQTMVIKALGHNPGSEFFMNETEHWKICERCKAEVEKTAHSYVGDEQCVCGYRKDGNRIVVKNDITVPDTLKDNENLDTPEEIKAELTTRIVAKDSKFTADNTVVMDVVLQVLDTDGKWVDAKPEDFAITGTITVLLPYPAGIDSSNYTKYDFMVSHMFTSDVNGKTPGDVEFPAFTKTQDGLLVTLTGLSPVAISYVVHVDDSGNQGNGGHYNGGHRGNGSSGSNGTAKPADDVKSSDTGDNSQMALWMGSVMLSAAALVVLTRKRKHSAK